MGRWAQRQRTSGANAPATIIKVTGLDPLLQQVLFDRPVPLPGPAGSAFESGPSGAIGTSVAIVTPTVIEVTYDEDIASDTVLDFTPPNPNYQAQTAIPIG